MNGYAIEIFCDRLYNTNYMPLEYYQNDKLLHSFPAPAYDNHLTDVFRSFLLQMQKSFCYLTTKTSHYYGLVQNPEMGIQLVIGPVFTFPVSRNDLPAILAEAGIAFSQEGEMWHYLHSLPCFSLNQFFNELALLHFILNQEEIAVKDILTSTLPADVHTMSAVISGTHTNSLYQAREEEIFHNTYFFEKEFFGYIRDGNVEKLKKMVDQVPKLQAGILADNRLRQEKNVFISSITQASRCSIEGGLDIETAYQLADSYTQEMERLFTPKDVQSLLVTAMFDYAGRVAECKMPPDMSPEIYQCLQYIGNHVNQPLSVEDVANAVNRNRSSLSRKFKAELGFNISDFILRRKLEEAKSLLAYTNKPVSEISSYLYFSSQSHLQTAFKTKYGMTPMDFRRQYHTLGGQK